MNSIMVDNWMIEDIIAIKDDESFQISPQYADLLSAILLWDNVYYPAN